MPPKLELKGVEIEKGTSMKVAEKFIGDKSMVIYPVTQNKEYSGMKPQE